LHIPFEWKEEQTGGASKQTSKHYEEQFTATAFWVWGAAGSSPNNWLLWWAASFKSLCGDNTDSSFWFYWHRYEFLRFLEASKLGFASFMSSFR
jgi:hypothetical protein